MRSGVIAQKLGMTRVFTEAGEHVPVTVLRLGQCQVLSHRTKEKNGYVALQLGSGTRKVNNVSKAERGNFAIAKVEPKRKLAEFRVEVDERDETVGKRIRDAEVEKIPVTVVFGDKESDDSLAVRERGGEQSTRTLDELLSHLATL